MKYKTVRWGMIGTGDVTRKKSAPSFNKIPNSKLVAVGNRTPEKAKEFAVANDIARWHENPHDVIKDPEVNIVYIATPPGSHLEYALETIAAGKPVYIEKPMARTAAECEQINLAADKSGIPVYVAYYRRSLPYFLKVKEILESGTLGKILTIHMDQHFPARAEDYNKESPPWRVVPEISGGGYFHDVGCHALDILIYLLGDPVEVNGQTTNLTELYEPEDHVTALVRFPGDILMSANWSFVIPEEQSKDRIHVSGENGSLSFSVFSFEPISVKTSNEEHKYNTDQPEHIQMPFITSIVKELTGEGKCPSTGETATIVSACMDSILGY